MYSLVEYEIGEVRADELALVAAEMFDFFVDEHVFLEISVSRTLQITLGTRDRFAVLLEMLLFVLLHGALVRAPVVAVFALDLFLLVDDLFVFVSVLVGVIVVVVVSVEGRVVYGSGVSVRPVHLLLMVVILFLCLKGVFTLPARVVGCSLFGSVVCGVVVSSLVLDEVTGVGRVVVALVTLVLLVLVAVLVRGDGIPVFLFPGHVGYSVPVAMVG